MLRIVQGDLLAQPVDAIVNSANGFLNHGGGVARLIDKAAMPHREHHTLWTDAERQWAIDHADAPLIPTGGAHATSAGELPFRGVVHAVGPVWGGGHYLESNLLSAAHANACSVAYDKGWRSLAFPAISCGIFGYPVDQAAPLAVATARFWAQEQPEGIGMDITFALFEDAHFDAYAEAASKLAPWAEVVR